MGASLSSTCCAPPPTLLAARELDPAFTHLGLEALVALGIGQGIDEIQCLAWRGGLKQLLLSGIGAAIEDIFPHRAVQQRGIPSPCLSGRAGSPGRQCGYRDHPPECVPAPHRKNAATGSPASTCPPWSAPLCRSSRRSTDLQIQLIQHPLTLAIVEAPPDRNALRHEWAAERAPLPHPALLPARVPMPSTTVPIFSNSMLTSHMIHWAIPFNRSAPD